MNQKNNLYNYINTFLYYILDTYELLSHKQTTFNYYY
jgi:hypothetical protein